MGNTKNSAYNLPNIQFCQYCSKECKNTNSLKQHECRCAKNPNRKETPIDIYNKTKHSSWNKGLSKETDIRVAKNSLKISQALKGKPGHPHTAEEKEKLRQSAIKHHLGGFNMRKAGIYYNGIKLDSSYELILAEDLDKNNIEWDRPGSFPYCLNGKVHQYTPDFYLPDYDIYLDPKNDFLINNINPNLGFSDIDKIKEVEKENNIKILILDKTQLSWNCIKEMLL